MMMKKRIENLEIEIEGKVVTCPTCGGSGKDYNHKWRVNGRGSWHYYKCEDCHGTGKTIEASYIGKIRDSQNHD